MNFFAHAFFAHKRSDHPAYLLGSMLPDFASMTGMRIVKIEHKELSAGVDFHHLGDSAFHGAPLFLRMMSEAREDLEAHGLELGPAMAVSHVGLELLLDGWLVEDVGTRPYLRAIEQAPRLGAAITWQQDPELAHTTWARLCDRLQRAPIPESYAEPLFVTERLQQILAKRPRLALQDDDFKTVLRWAEQAKTQLWRQARPLLDQVEERLCRLEQADSSSQEISTSRE